MTHVNRKIQSVILAAIGWLYTPFRRIIPDQLFRYGVSGGANMVFDWVLYFLLYNYVFDRGILRVGQIAVSAHIASFLVSFPISFLSGFWLSRYISFKESSLRSATQLARYLLVVAGCIALNYVCLKFFVEVCHFYPTPSKMITTGVTTIFSFVMQKFFSFRA